jgi:hypothetical protein
MADTTKEDRKAAQTALEILLKILPRSETAIRHITYTVGLICRESGIPVERATDLVMSWSERLRAIPNFPETYPRYRKPSFYRSHVRGAVRNAYRRMQDKPSYYWFKSLTAQEAPAASFWVNLRPVRKKSKPRRPKRRSNGRCDKTQNNQRSPRTVARPAFRDKTDRAGGKTHHFGGYPRVST